MNRFLFAFCLYILSSFSSTANSPVRFTHYSNQDGLPNDFILSIVQDDYGFIWFGTHLGIVRFDGHSYELFQPDPQKLNSLSYKHINTLYHDLYGNLWIRFTENALNRMNTQTGKFYNYLPDKAKPGSISGLRVTDFIEDSDSILWIATRTGLNIYNNKKDEFHKVTAKSFTNESYPSNEVLTLSDDTLGNIWFLSINGIGRINRKNHEIVSLRQLINTLELDSSRITFMETDHQSRLWFTTKKNQLYTYEIATGQLTNYPINVIGIQSLYCDKNGNVYVFSEHGNTLYYIDKQEISEGTYSKYNLFGLTDPVSLLSVNEDKRGNIWISSSHGLDMFNSKSGIMHYKHDPLQKQSLSSNYLNLSFVDQTNNLWVSNYRKGLDKADLNQKPFNWNFTNPDQSNNVFLGTNITSVLEDSDNKLWIGAAGNSIIRFDRKTNAITPVNITVSRNTMFSALFEDSEGDLWVGSYDEGIYRINMNTLKLSYSCYWSESEGIAEYIKGVREIVEDKERNIWFVSTNGIHKWERKSGRVIPYSGMHDKHTPEHGFYRTLIIDKSGIVWSGSYNGGLARYDIKENSVKRYLNTPNDKTSISGNGVYTIFEESDSTFLIGTTMGLNRFNRNSEKFSLVETNKSIYNYSIYTIIPDSQNNYWMATDNGLIRLNEITLECTFYNEGDGLLANEFNTTASCVSNTGDVYLGSPKGLVSFNPQEFTLNPYTARPTITNLQISNITIEPGDTLNGRVVLTKQIWATDELELNYHENDFTLQFSAMHFAVPENNKFWYMLEGYRDEWIPTDANRRWASFTGLPPGIYTFKLIASNNDGVKCKPEDAVELKIIINPPFWMTIWFKVLVVLILASALGFFIRLRFIRIKELNAHLEQKINERTKELRDVNISLKEQQKEINVQKGSLEEANIILRTTQEEIITQNKELDIHRNKLEFLVEARTRELAEALNKAEESDSLKSSFLANMSHEIRTPMNAIVGFSMLLRDEDVNDATKKAYFNTIIKNSESLLVLIDDILDLSKIQSNQFKFSLVPQNLSTILSEMYKMFSIEGLKKNVPLKLNVDKINIEFTLVTDEVRLKQVISNLLSNAIKFTQEGLVEFGVFENTDELTIYVKDTGIGIPENVGEAVFERFAKLEDDNDNLYRGTGLGLAISKSLVNLWGGKLWYESVKNSGTTFYFTHPIGKPRKVSPAKELEEQSIPLNLNGLTVLIAEDEESNYNLILAYLKKTGANVLWAKNGKESCDLVDSNTVDLILMDLKMPIMGGIEAAKIIKQKYPKLPVIAQTAFTNANENDLLLNKVFDSFILKPIKPNELLMAIGKFV